MTKTEANETMIVHDDDNIILMNGPPFLWKSALNKLVKDFHPVFPQQIFQENPCYGLRDIALSTIKTVNQGSKVVIVDTNESRKTRDSFITLFKKKCKDVSIATLSLFPKYGCEQVFWMREYHVAAQCARDGVPGAIDTVDDEEIRKWFASENDEEIHYRQGIVDEPLEDEGCRLRTEQVTLHCESNYKFEVPALFIHWEVVQSLETSETLGQLAAVCDHWLSVCLHGRIIVVCDGSSINTGETDERREVQHIQKILCQFTQTFSVCPVYAMLIHCPRAAGSYCAPPRPGILAYLQARHCLDLHSKGTLYLYETTSHMKMAEHAGVRHIKAGRVLEQPSLVVSDHTATIQAIPTMLQDIELLGNQEIPASARIPLGNKRDLFHQGCVYSPMAGGRSEFLFASSWDIIERYQQHYSELVTPAGEPGSRLWLTVQSKTPSSKTEKKRDRGSSGEFARRSSGTSAQDTSARDLPHWMMAKDTSTSSMSEASLGHTTRVKKTMYVMTDKELTDLVKEVLKQAGKSDLVDHFEKTEECVGDTGKSPRGKTTKSSSWSNKTKSRQNKTNEHSAIEEASISENPELEAYTKDKLNDSKPAMEVDSHFKEQHKDMNKEIKGYDVKKSGESHECDELKHDGEDIGDLYCKNDENVRYKTSRKRAGEVDNDVSDFFDELIADDVDTSNKDRNKRKLSDLTGEGQVISDNQPKGSRKRTINSNSKSNKEYISNKSDKRDKQKHVPDLSILDDIF